MNLFSSISYNYNASRMESQPITADKLVPKVKELNTSWVSLTFLSSNYRTVTRELNTMQAVDLQTFLNTLCDTLANEGNNDPIAVLDALADLLPLESLMENAQTVEEALKQAAVSFQRAQYHAKIKSDGIPSTVGREVSRVLDSILTTINGFVKLLDFSALVDPDEETDPLSLQFRFQSMMEFFTVIGTVLATYAATSALSPTAVSAILLGIGFLAISWKYIKPQPRTLRNFTPISRDIENGQIPTSNGTSKGVKQIAKNIKAGFNVMVIGPPRTGKNQNVYAFVKEILRKEHPELAHMQAHYINTASISQLKNSPWGGGAAAYLAQLEKEMGSYADNMILIFDEIHNAYMLESNLGENLKNYLEAGGKFRHVIGITTVGGYEKYIKGNAFADRFERVYIENTGRDETIKIMNEYLIHAGKTEAVTQESIEEIYEIASKLPNARLPFHAINLLKKCVTSTDRTQDTPHEQELDDLIIKRDGLLASNALPSFDTLQSLNQEIEELQKVVDKEKKQIDAVFHAKDLVAKADEEAYKTILKVSKSALQTLKIDNAADSKLLKRWILINKFMKPALSSYVQKVAEEACLNIQISPDHVRSIHQANPEETDREGSPDSSLAAAPGSLANINEVV